MQLQGFPIDSHTFAYDKLKDSDQKKEVKVAGNLLHVSSYWGSNITSKPIVQCLHSRTGKPGNETRVWILWYVRLCLYGMLLHVYGVYICVWSLTLLWWGKFPFVVTSVGRVYTPGVVRHACRSGSEEHAGLVATWGWGGGTGLEEMWAYLSVLEVWDMQLS